MGLYQLAKNNRVVQKIYEPVKRRFRGQEPVYYLFDSVVRPFFSWLILKSARARFAILTLCDDILFENQSKGQERVSEETIKRFGASDYHYGDQQLDTGIPIEQRLSGQILPILEPLLAIPDVKIVLEIGCGNGLIAERLARQHPNMKFIGIDFAVPKSSPGRFPDNLEFRAGYALDLLGPEQFPVSPDVVYFQFTATKFLPREILGYFAKFRKLGSAISPV